jgi:hypothetical protein
MHLHWLRRVMGHQAIWRRPQTSRFKAWHRECPYLHHNADDGARPLPDGSQVRPVNTGQIH